MGQVIKSLFTKNSKKMQINLFMFGVLAPGKTTIINKFKNGKIVESNPTIGYIYEQIKYKDKRFDFKEASGGYRLYEIFKRLINDSDAIIIAVDSSQLIYGFYENLLQSTLKSCLQELIQLKKEKIPILILANKTDKSQHSDEEIISYTSVNKYQDIAFFKLIRTNCFTGEGLLEALEWIYENVQK
ncbi:hypothetical protein ABPG72_011150 [Tetrahymena utriculariae]